MDQRPPEPEITLGSLLLSAAARQLATLWVCRSLMRRP